MTRRDNNPDVHDAFTLHFACMWNQKPCVCFYRRVLHLKLEVTPLIRANIQHMNVCYIIMCLLLIISSVFLFTYLCHAFFFHFPRLFWIYLNKLASHPHAQYNTLTSQLSPYPRTTGLMLPSSRHLRILPGRRSCRPVTPSSYQKEAWSPPGCRYSPGCWGSTLTPDIQGMVEQIKASLTCSHQLTTHVLIKASKWPTYKT